MNKLLNKFILLGTAAALISYYAYYAAPFYSGSIDNFKRTLSLFFQGHLSVEVWFFLMGTLFYKWIHKFDKKQKIQSLLGIIISYYVILFFNLAITGLFGFEANQKYAWANFLFLNNFVPGKYQFMEGTWVVAAFVQLLPFPLLFSKYWNGKSIVIITLAAIFFRVLLVFQHDLNPNVLLPIFHPALGYEGFHHEYNDLFYTFPLTRFFPFFLGFYIWKIQSQLINIFFKVTIILLPISLYPELIFPILKSKEYQQIYLASYSFLFFIPFSLFLVKRNVIEIFSLFTGMCIFNFFVLAAPIVNFCYLMFPQLTLVPPSFQFIFVGVTTSLTLLLTVTISLTVNRWVNGLRRPERIQRNPC